MITCSFLPRPPALAFLLRGLLLSGLLFNGTLMPSRSVCWADGGVLQFRLSDESTGEPAISRCELWRPDRQKPSSSRHRPPNLKKLFPVPRVVPAGIGFVLDRQAEFASPDGTYHFRLTRGPEYRVVTGNFTLEKTSSDQHSVALPRMVNMLDEGWISGDCFAPAQAHSLSLRMASEDLHVAAVDHAVPPRPIPGRDLAKDPIDHAPLWIRTDAVSRPGIIIYGDGKSGDVPIGEDLNELPSETMMRSTPNPEIKIAIENPFAWALPIWLATEQIDGVFLLGDWLRLDREIKKVPSGRPAQSIIRNTPQAVGRWAETIYYQMLESGLRIPPLAGSGDTPGKSPIGYNRVYAAIPAAPTPAAIYAPLKHAPQGTEDTQEHSTAQQWWQAVWKGHSIVTNGPCIRPTLSGHFPGHDFRAIGGQTLSLQPELKLAVRDRVEYLEVIHNGDVHYSARLKDFAQAGGQIPEINATESGWVIIRVITQYEQHLRAAYSAPWYITFDNQPRIKKESVRFFQQWLSEYETRLKKMPRDQLQPHIAHVRRARAFWNRKSAASN